MRKSLLTVGVMAVAIVLATSAFAASRGVTFTRVGFIEDPGDYPASQVYNMNPQGTVFMVTPTPYGNYCFQWTMEEGWGTEVGEATSLCFISRDGSIMADGYTDGLDQPSHWLGQPNLWDPIPAPDDYVPCGPSSVMGVFGMGGNADHATGLTWIDGCKGQAFYYNRAADTTVNLGHLQSRPGVVRSSRGNDISDDGSRIVGWNENLFGQWRGAQWIDGEESFIDGQGPIEPLVCAESGLACTFNGDDPERGCPEFVDDAYCNNQGSCDLTDIACDLTGITCDKTGITCDKTGVTCDLTGIDCVDGFCTGGANAGEACSGYWNCPGFCDGGANDGGECTSDYYCPGFCDGGANDGGSCTDDYYCPGYCDGGANDGGVCTGASNCPGYCTGGSNAGGECTADYYCPGACTTGPNTGGSCTSDYACPGTCVGGENEGGSCTDSGSYYCPDTQVCVPNPDFDLAAYKGEAFDISADGKYVLGENYGDSDWNEPDYDWTLWASAWVQNPNGSFTKVPPPPAGYEGDSWTPIQMSDDGNVVVGTYGWWIYSYPVMWIRGVGTVDFQLFLVSQGLDELWFWYLTNLNAVSADGTIVAGAGYNPENWLEGFVVDIKKMKICHAPPGNPANERTLSISMNSVGDHLNHGDFLGTCEFKNSGALSRASELRPERPAVAERSAIEATPADTNPTIRTQEEHSRVRGLLGTETNVEESQPRQQRTRAKKSR